ncbi:MAG TPA: serine/threonine-protein kinase, partial [Blastocatellia bacterium]
MKPSMRWQQVESLFHAALIREGSEREIFLSEACSSDPSIRVEVESLIAAHERTGLADLAVQDLLSDLIEETELYLTPGQYINHYQVIGLIGKGGMGIVYKAEDTRLMRPVAIKVFSKRGKGKWAAEPGYLREARAGSALNHPNIVTIHEIGETADITYIIMEYVEAQNLSEIIASSVLASDQILSIAAQICDGLAEVHSRQILHRDVKPANVMVTNRGQVKLLDFGIASPFQALSARQGMAVDSKAQKKSSEVVGTICYMSPEQIRGEPLDERTDIFSFGVLLYEMITGELPFSGQRAMDVAAAILKDAPAQLTATPEGLPQGARDIVMRCLEKDREKRPSSFVEVRKELEYLMLQSPVIMGPQHDQKSSKKGSLFRSPGRYEFNYKPKAPPLPIILVLPFDSLSVRAGEESLGLGLSHMISTNLARVKGLSVVSKAAVERQTERLADSPLGLARELGATLMMEGEMMSMTDGYAIMVRLTEVATGHIIWGSQYFGESSDLFRIQQRLCKEIASALKVDIS